MNQPIRMHNIRKRMGRITPSEGSVTSQVVLADGRQIALDENGSKVDPIKIFAR